MENVISEGILVAGVALGPLVSIIISILKNWVKMDKKVIALLNVFLGIIAITIYSVYVGGLPIASAAISSFGVAFSSKLFHDTFGHALEALLDLLGKEE